MPKIASISVCAARVPLARATAFARRTVTARDYGLVKVRSTDGVEGIGFCYVGNRGGERLPVAVEPAAGAGPARARLVRRRGPVWQAMYQEALLHGRAGTKPVPGNARWGRRG